ncbi:MAG: GGDEF domain-containing protein [Treponema sp.]|uniref:GGDEF domain-containing protein n=1 Tax=Treponema sp. TaxID=166 RepID=UPI0025DA62BD|nr:GGDEF domain-containing protein [Treponema sp.]MBQ8679449.1 GGDEF domain-containing protein [Treponema sp.]
MDNFFRENEIKTDPVTGVYAQSTISSYANHLIREKTPFSFALIDVDNFTYINDAFGHEGGNKVLYDIANTIKSILGDKGVLARNKGDEFSIILKDITVYDEIWNICHTILVKVNEIELPDIGTQTITVTIGLDRFPENATSYDDLLSCAEKALYRGKTKGRNCFIIYLPEKHASIVPKSEKQKAVGSLNLHSNILKFLTASDDLKSGIQNLINFISSYFEIDHVCIQTDSQILFQKIHQRSRTKDFRLIPTELIKNSTNPVTGVLYMDGIGNLLKAKKNELYELLEEQEITSSCIAEIEYRDEIYGMLRLDMTGTETDGRLLQYSDIDLLLTAARTIALILHYTGRRIEDL